MSPTQIRDSLLTAVTEHVSVSRETLTPWANELALDAVRVSLLTNPLDRAKAEAHLRAQAPLILQRQLTKSSAATNSLIQSSLTLAINAAFRALLPHA